MIDHVVFDVEIQKRIEDLPNKWNDTHLMGVSCACLWEHQTERMRVYGPDEVHLLRERLEKAERISGFNIRDFDYNVVYALPKDKKVDWLFHKTSDVLQRIWSALGETRYKGFGLDPVCKATLGYGKIGNGEDAPRWYHEGKLHKVINYCCDDTCLERDLEDFIDKYGFIINPNTGTKLFIPSWSPLVPKKEGMF